MTIKMNITDAKSCFGISFSIHLVLQVVIDMTTFIFFASMWTQGVKRDI